MKVVWPFQLAKRFNRVGFVAFQLLLLTALPGCWTAPNANVQPPGEPRMVQRGVPVESFHDLATVHSIDADRQFLTLELPDGNSLVCHISPQVRTSRPLQPGDRIKVTLSGKMAFYVLQDGRLPVAGGTNEAINVCARVQSLDRSYRLLTLQYGSGRTEVLKVALGADLTGIQPGDSVELESAEAIKIHIEKP